ncbi:hypothetical protein QC823_15740 [Halomonas vilamensis]|uniref:Uncharacterized protein n=1 Tax=Vreelandella vilamensis TaxID=531309 RepID=A0ABU1H7Y7_9GAMM|nr:hypothetical protein [Halomonas vilamensis]MDR5900416.1 hypothetical protein [Halomonas vilamensis]
MAKRLSFLVTRSLSGRAAAHRAMARAALFSDYSLRVRYRRYRCHMEKARALDAKVASFTLSATVQEVRS